jgi:hypothetical protein
MTDTFILQLLAALGPVAGVLLRHYVPSLGDLLPGGGKSTPAVPSPSPTPSPTAAPAYPILARIEAQLQADVQAFLSDRLGQLLQPTTPMSQTPTPPATPATK